MAETSGIEQIQLLDCLSDPYGGVTVEIKEHMEADIFAPLLRASLSSWKEEGKKGVWIKLPLESSHLVDILVKEKFRYHHAEPNYLMLVLSLPDTIPVNDKRETRERGVSSANKNPQNPQVKGCSHWILDNCVKCDACPLLHSWSHGIDIAMLARLEGHKKGISGIALPSGSAILYTGSEDGTARVWDCCTGQCVEVINLGGEVGCFTCEGPWVFLGMPNTVKAWNSQNGASYEISGPARQVHAMVVAEDMLFAGVQDGDILVWKGGSEADPFQMMAHLKGHTQGVVSLTVGHDRLYSGSIDQTIRVWHLHTLECVQELVGHTDVVTSILCWDRYLISCSLDQTVKVWVVTKRGSLEVAYTHHEDHGILALSGMDDAGGKPVLLCACLDNTVRLYELPWFTKRGEIFFRREVRTLQTAPEGIFFTGDAAGMLTVWNWS